MQEWNSNKMPHGFECFIFALTVLWRHMEWHCMSVESDEKDTEQNVAVCISLSD